MKSLLEEIENALNSASEVFLMVAIISLLALPFAVAVNLTPVSKPLTIAANPPITRSVLGAQTISGNITTTPVVSSITVVIMNPSSSNYVVTHDSSDYKITLIGNTTNPLFTVINPTNHVVAYMINTTSTGLDALDFKINESAYNIKSKTSINIPAKSSSTIGITTKSQSLPLTFELSVDIK